MYVKSTLTWGEGPVQSSPGFGVWSSRLLRSLYWVAVKELSLSYYHGIGFIGIRV